MKCTSEVRFLVLSVTVLTALVVPVAAATFGAEGAPFSDAAPVATGTHATASAGLLVEGAPPPLLFMALGTLLVLAMIGRRARRLALEPAPRDASPR